MNQDQSNAWPRLTMVVGVSLVAVALIAGVSGYFFAGESGPDITTQAIEKRRASLHELAARYVNEHKLARSDGYVKTIDAAQLTWYFALAGDRERYRTMRDRLVEKTVVDEPERAITRHFVAWRYWPGDTDKPLDASGTTEALRVAKALWIGANQFDRPKDRELAINILRGYARHQATFSGIWLIRNYYHLRQHHFVTNSYTIDYDPDLLAAAATHTENPTLRTVAEKSAAKVKQALSPAGLVRQIIQPELKTLMPDEDAIFSPNDIEQLSNSAEVATCAHRTAEEVGRSVLDFALNRSSYLRQLYNASTGEPVTTDGAGAETYGPLVRLAIQQDRPSAMRRMLRRLMAVSSPEAIEAMPLKSRAYNLGQTLLALQRVQRYRDKNQSTITVE